MVVLTVMLVIATVQNVNGIASLANGLLKNLKTSEKVRTFCTKNPNACKGFYNMANDPQLYTTVSNQTKRKLKTYCRTNPTVCHDILKIASHKKQSKTIATKKTSSSSSITYHKTNNKVKTNTKRIGGSRRTFTRNDVICEFSNRANGIISRITDDVTNGKVSDKEKIIKNIKEYIKELVLLPRSNVVCHYRNGKIERAIREAFRLQKMLRKRQEDKAVKEIQSVFTNADSAATTNDKKKNDNENFATAASKVEPVRDKKHKIVDTLLNTINDDDDTGGYSSDDYNKMTTNRIQHVEGDTVESLQKNLKNLFMFLSHKDGGWVKEEANEEKGIEEFVEELKHTNE